MPAAQIQQAFLCNILDVNVLCVTVSAAEDDHSGGGCYEQEDEGDRTCAGNVFSHLV